MSRNSNAFMLERVDEEAEVIPQAALNGYSFVEWVNDENEPLSIDTVAQDEIFYASYVDDIAPGIDVQISSDATSEQNFMITGTDEGSGVMGYYFGTSDPAENDVTFCETNTGVVDVEGTYYFAVGDVDGNVTIESYTFYTLSFDVNGGSSIYDTVLLKEGTELILENPQKPGYSGSWIDESTGCTVESTIADSNKSFLADYVDDIAPTIDIQISSDADSAQGFTITGTDEGSGVMGYYFGTSNPAENDVTFCETNTGVVDAGGTYYFAVIDYAGNVTTESRTFYTFTLNANGGTVPCETILLAEGCDFTLPPATKTGYSNVWVEDGTENAVTSAVVDGNKTFTALWSANEYTITFDANGGSCDEQSRVVTYDTAYGELPTPTRSGYSFLGWYTTTSGGEQILPETTVSCTSDTTLYANWKTLTVTISGGSLSVDDYWFPARNCSAGISVPVRSNIYITVTQQSGCVFWVEGGVSGGRIYGPGTYHIGTVSAGYVSISLGANIASGCSNGSVSWSNITAVPVE